MKRLMHIIAGVVAAGGLALAAVGQNQMGDGRMLDNNLRQGSGGYNAPQAADGRVDTRINSGNAVVTGNVPGLRYFHEDVGYSAPGEFRGTLSGDSLFRFRAQSYNPTVGTAPIPRAAAGYAGGETVELYRVGAMPGAGSGGGFGYRTVDPGSGLQVYRPTYGVAGSRLAAPAYYGAPLGYVQGDSGLMQINASPLLGVRQRPMGVPGALPTAGEQRQAIGAWLPADGLTQEGGEVQVAPSAALRPTVAPSAASDVERRLSGRLDEPSQPSPPADVGQLSSGAQPALAPGAQPRQDQQGRTAYANLLRKLRQEDRSAEVAGSAAEALRRQEERLEGREREPGEPTGEPTVAMREPTTEELAKAEQARQEAIRQSLGLAAGPSAEGEAKPEGPVLPPGYEDLLEKLDSMPRVGTMAGDAEGALAELYQAAEAAMASGEYFAALDRYRQVQQRWPQETMAVAGEVHAAMGAGMVRSAALTLRRLLEKHPELIAVRYDPRLLPNEERLRWVREQLDQMVATARTPDAGLLLAYVGYQINSQTLLRYGLDLAQSVAPKDEGLALLRRVWLDRR